MTARELADLDPGKKPRLSLDEVDEDPTLSVFQRKVLHELMFFANHSASADRLALYLKYKPATSGRLAVSSALRALLDPESRDGAAGYYITRIPARDQWDSATWTLNHRLVCRRDKQGRRCAQVLNTETQAHEWVVIDEPAPRETPLPPGKRRVAHRL